MSLSLMFRQKQFPALCTRVIYFTVLFMCLLYHNTKGLAPPAPHYIGGSPSPGGQEEQQAVPPRNRVNPLRLARVALRRLAHACPLPIGYFSACFWRVVIDKLSNSKFPKQMQVFHRKFSKKSSTNLNLLSRRFSLTSFT